MSHVPKTLEHQVAELREQLLELDSHRIQGARTTGDLIKAIGELTISSSANTRAWQHLTGALASFQLEQNKRGELRDREIRTLKRQVKKLFSLTKKAGT